MCRLQQIILYWPTLVLLLMFPLHPSPQVVMRSMPLPGPLLGAWKWVQGGCTQFHSLQDGAGVCLLEPERDSHLPAGLAMPTSTTIVL